MYIKTTYKGTLNGVYGIYCGFKPDGLDVEEEVPVYYPSEGKIFIKDGEEYSAVVLQEGESIEDYTEVDIPEEQDITEEN
jgi:hypothetical protein